MRMLSSTPVYQGFVVRPAVPQVVRVPSTDPAKVRSAGFIWGYLLLALLFLAVTVLVSAAK